MAEKALDVQAFKDVLARKLLRPVARREAVRYLQTRWVSERRACKLVGISRSSMRYRGCGRDDMQVWLRL